MASQIVNASMTMGEIVSKYPETIEVLLSHGLHCVGCGVSAYETLQQGAQAHGMTPQEVEEMLEEANKAIAEADASGNSINVTKKASEKIRALLMKENKPNQGIRLEITRGGCAGSAYSLSFDEAKPGDETIEEKGIKFFLKRNDLQKIEGIKIDFVDALQGSGFKISNPNANKTCGCGQSFH